jgi:hypothetical protein
MTAAVKPAAAEPAMSAAAMSAPAMSAAAMSAAAVGVHIRAQRHTDNCRQRTASDPRFL